MTILTLGAAACNRLADDFERLPVREPEACQRISDTLRECAEWHSGARVHIEMEKLEPEESEAVKTELRLVPSNVDAERKLEVVELALYRLKERDYATAADVRAIDELLATSPELKADLYDLIRFHEGPSS